jgi:hypothetical protein
VQAFMVKSFVARANFFLVMLLWFGDVYPFVAVLI